MSEKIGTITPDRKAEISVDSVMTVVRTLLPIIGLAVVFITFDIWTKGEFHKAQKLPLIFSSLYVTMIASTGVFFVMTMGGLDFSQGAILGMASIAICMCTKIQLPEAIAFLHFPIAIVAGIVTGALIGAFNGYFYVNRKIKSFIVTICSMFLFRGIIRFMTSSSPVTGSIDLITLGMNNKFKVICTVVVVGTGILFFHFTRFGVSLRSIGAGEKAAKFAGIHTDRMKFLMYVLAGAITGFAAFISVCKTGSVTASGGNQLETRILISLVLGGMPISGGAKCSFLNVIIGSIMFTLLEQGLNMVHIEVPTQQLIEGVVFLLFVFVFADRKSLQVIK